MLLQKLLEVTPTHDLESIVKSPMESKSVEEALFNEQIRNEIQAELLQRKPKAKIHNVTIAIESLNSDEDLKAVLSEILEKEFTFKILEIKTI